MSYMMFMAADHHKQISRLQVNLHTIQIPHHVRLDYFLGLRTMFSHNQFAMIVFAASID